MMTRLIGFQPVASPSARCLILGSMPGEASLQAGQYYAFSRNHFWPIMDELMGIGRDLPYDERLVRLKAHGIALWDVLYSCKREGSLDENIEAEEANDLNGFLARHPHIKTIGFNGQKAARYFQKHVRLDPGKRPNLITLPSTSPANTQTLPTKARLWREILLAS